MFKLCFTGAKSKGAPPEDSPCPVQNGPSAPPPKAIDSFKAREAKALGVAPPVGAIPASRAFSGTLRAQGAAQQRVLQLLSLLSSYESGWCASLEAAADAIREALDATHCAIHVVSVDGTWGAVVACSGTGEATLPGRNVSCDTVVNTSAPGLILRDLQESGKTSPLFRDLCPPGPLVDSLGGGGGAGLTQAALSTFSTSTVAGLGLPPGPVTTPQLPELSCSPQTPTALLAAAPASGGGPIGQGPTPMPSAAGARQPTPPSSTWSPRLTSVAHPASGVAAPVAVRAGAGVTPVAVAVAPGVTNELPVEWQVLAAGAGCRHFAAAAACSSSGGGTAGVKGSTDHNGSGSGSGTTVVGVLSLAARGPGRPAGWTPEVLQAAVGLLAPHLRRAQAVLASPAAAQLHAATSVGDLLSAVLATAADAAEAVAFVRGQSRLAIVHSGASAAAIFQQQAAGVAAGGGNDTDSSVRAGPTGSDRGGAVTLSGSAPRGNFSRRSFTLDFVPRKTAAGLGGGGGGGGGIGATAVAAALAGGGSRAGKPPPMSAPDHERVIMEPVGAAAGAAAGARGVRADAGTPAGGIAGGDGGAAASLGPEWTLGGMPRAISGVPEYFNQSTFGGSTAGGSTVNSSRTGQSTGRVLGGGGSTAAGGASFLLNAGKSAGPACKGHTLLLKGQTLLEEALARGRQDGSAGLCVEDCQAHSLNAKAIPRDLVLSRGAPMPLSLALATLAAPAGPSDGSGGIVPATAAVAASAGCSAAGAPTAAAVIAVATAGATQPTAGSPPRVAPAAAAVVAAAAAGSAVRAGSAAAAAAAVPQQLQQPQVPELALYMTYSSALPPALLRAVVQELQQLLQALLPILTVKLRGPLDQEYRLMLNQISYAAQRKAGNGSLRGAAASRAASGSSVAYVVQDAPTGPGTANGYAMGSPFSTLFEEGHGALEEATLAGQEGAAGAGLQAGGGVAEAEAYDEQGLRSLLGVGEEADMAAVAGAAARILNFTRGSTAAGAAVGAAGTAAVGPRSAVGSTVGIEGGGTGTASMIARLYGTGPGTGTGTGTGMGMGAGTGAASGLGPGAPTGASPPGLSLLALAAAGGGAGGCTGTGDVYSLEGEMDLRLVPRPASLLPHLGGTGLFGSVWGGGGGVGDPLSTLQLAGRSTAGGGALGSGVGSGLGSGVGGTGGGSATDMQRPFSMGGAGSGVLDAIYRRANTRPGSLGQWQGGMMGSSLRPVSFKLEAAEAPRGASKLAPLMASLHERIRAAQTAQLAVGRSESTKADLESVRLVQEIGHGGYGTVYRGTYHGAEVAIKIIKQSRLAAMTGQQQGSASNTGAASAPLLHKQNLHDAIEVVASVSMSHFNLVQVPAFFMDVRVIQQDEYAAAGDCAFSAPGNAVSDCEGPVTAESNATGAAACATAGATATAGGPTAGARAAAAGPAVPSESQPLRLIQAPSLLASPLPGTDVSCSEGAMALILEYCDRGSLCDAIMQKKFIERVTPKNGPPGKTYLAINMRSVYATLLEVALALRHMHSLHLVHCDLKPQNVLLKSSPRDPRGFTAKLSDFGLSKMMAADEDTGQLVIDDTVASGTITHVAPEVLLGQKTLTAAVDIYSFGILMQQMLCGMRVYDKTNATDIANAVAHKGMRPALPHWVPTSYRSLASACWHHSAANRPTADQLVARLEKAIETKQQRSGSSTSSGAAKAAAAAGKATAGSAAAGGGGAVAHVPPPAGAAATMAAGMGTPAAATVAPTAFTR
ncbi:hypothetical protein HYH02_013752 [Chlamydomonas schloesseri]|uniref:Protein kinase domain-containing protein n=1 Tax=Chlamydomonas schloesseri TaxID=2026947 RepID=A0A835VWE9_9CHLO|nr:hypothetical protein HYH02_013752 [Chlamydomonas schloesseri]|eukprot:KAG2430390.1 hypothetical protein HYH02_013752 [Chlamydomonas schloesseri]